MQDGAQTQVASTALHQGPSSALAQHSCRARLVIVCLCEEATRLQMGAGNTTAVVDWLAACTAPRLQALKGRPPDERKPTDSQLFPLLQCAATHASAEHTECNNLTS